MMYPHNYSLNLMRTISLRAMVMKSNYQISLMRSPHSFFLCWHLVFFLSKSVYLHWHWGLFLSKPLCLKFHIYSLSDYFQIVLMSVCPFSIVTLILSPFSSVLHLLYLQFSYSTFFFALFCQNHLFFSYWFIFDFATSQAYTQTPFHLCLQHASACTYILHK